MRAHRQRFSAELTPNARLARRDRHGHPGIDAPIRRGPTARAGEHLPSVFATQEMLRTTTSPAVPPPFGRFGGVAAADWQVTNAAFNVGLPGTLGWDGVSPLYQSIISISGNNAVSRVSIAGPVYNMHGELLATGHADLFDGDLAAVVGYDEHGEAIVDDLQTWTGSEGIGVWSGTSCQAWNSTSSMTTGRVGSALATTPSWLSMGVNRTCNLSARLYAVSLALVAPLWGDYDGSGTVDGGDFLEWQRQLGQEPSATFTAARAFTANATQPPTINAADLAVWRTYYGAMLSPPTVIPEPATWTILLAGLAASGRRRS
jgi:hypothetical protein